MGLDSQMVWNKKGLLKYKYDFFKKTLNIRAIDLSEDSDSEHEKKQTNKQNTMKQNPRP